MSPRVSSVLQHVVVALVVTIVVGLASGGTWPYFVVGAVLALALWVMLFAGSYAGPQRGRTSAAEYAAAAAIGLVIGYVMTEVGDGSSWWAVGFILAGVLVPAGRTAQRQG